MVKIIDAFIFYNELDLLTYRLNVLNEVVDYVIIVESTHTHKGTIKPLFFNDSKYLFEKFNHKIIHIIVDDFPCKYINKPISINDCWKNENFQRNAIARGISSITSLDNSDAIIISDLDEIPDPFTLQKIKQGTITITKNILMMDLYYYNLNTLCTHKWQHARIVSYKIFKELNNNSQVIRTGVYDCIGIPNGGWHLSYFGDKYFIQNKIQNFAHQELNKPEYTNLQNIEFRLQNSLDVYGRNDSHFYKIQIKDNIYLPVGYNIYLNKYFTI